MSKTNTKVTENLRKKIEAAIKAAMEKGELPEGDIPSFVIEEPADRSHGDIATNAAMAGARAMNALSRKPRGKERWTTPCARR